MAFQIKVDVKRFTFPILTKFKRIYFSWNLYLSPCLYEPRACMKLIVKLFNRENSVLEKKTIRKEGKQNNYWNSVLLFNKWIQASTNLTKNKCMIIHDELILSNIIIFAFINFSTSPNSTRNNPLNIGKDLWFEWC